MVTTEFLDRKKKRKFLNFLFLEKSFYIFQSPQIIIIINNYIYIYTISVIKY